MYHVASMLDSEAARPLPKPYLFHQSSNTYITEVRFVCRLQRLAVISGLHGIRTVTTKPIKDNRGRCVLATHPFSELCTSTSILHTFSMAEHPV
ncbi:hypothetical protein N7488_000549 [Penicillium malachiteum]|nr:hypothetical protein N7488_000549 [Penicillium malachiteum]